MKKLFQQGLVLLAIMIVGIQTISASTINSKNQSEMYTTGTALRSYQQILERDYLKTQVLIKNTSQESSIVNLWSSQVTSSKEPAYETVSTFMDAHNVGSGQTNLTNQNTNATNSNTTFGQSESIGAGINVPNGALDSPNNGFENPNNDFNMPTYNPNAVGSNNNRYIGIHPNTGNVYMLNQLTNSIEIATSTGESITDIILSDVFPGVISPSAIAFDTDTDYVYVVGSVSDTVFVINPNHEIENIIDVGTRPIDVAYNHVNKNVYVANLVDNTISVIDTVNQAVSDTIEVREDPLKILIDSDTGSVYTFCEGDYHMTVVDSLHQGKLEVEYPPSPILEAVYHSGEEKVYLIIDGSTVLHSFDTLEVEDAFSNNGVHNPPPAIPVPFNDVDLGMTMTSLAYNEHNNHLFATNPDGTDLLMIAPDQTVTLLSSLVEEIPSQIEISTSENSLYVLADNGVTLIGWGVGNSAIVFDDGYNELREEFKQSPIMMKHVKMISCDIADIHSMRLKDKQPTGRVKESPFSFGPYRSPQNKAGVLELFGMEGQIIDRHTEWEMELPPNSSVTFLFYYRQMDLMSFVNGQIANV